MGIGDVMILAAVFVWIAAVGCLDAKEKNRRPQGLRRSL